MNVAFYVQTENAKKWVSVVQNDMKYQHYIVIYHSLRELMDIMSEDYEFDIIFLDFNCLKDVIGYVKTVNQKTRIATFGTRKTFIDISPFIKRGLVAFIDMHASVFELFNGFQFIREGKLHFPQYMIEELIQYHIRDSVKQPDLSHTDAIRLPQSKRKLTDKELKVFDLLMKGQTYKEIALSLGISVFAVNQRIKYIYKKYDVRSRGELSFMINGIGSRL